MNSLVKTKKQVSTIMIIVMFISLFVGGFTLPVLADNERIDQDSDIIIPLASSQKVQENKSGNKAAIMGAVIAGSIVAISGLPMLTIAAGAAVGYVGVTLTKKAIGLFRGKGNNVEAVKAQSVQSVVSESTEIDASLVELESARCEEYIAQMNKNNAANNNYQQSSSEATNYSQSSSQTLSRSSSISTTTSYNSYEKAYKEYLAAVQDGDASLANEKFAEYKKYKEAYQEQTQ